MGATELTAEGREEVTEKPTKKKSVCQFAKLGVSAERTIDSYCWLSKLMK